MSAAARLTMATVPCENRYPLLFPLSRAPPPFPGVSALSGVVGAWVEGRRCWPDVEGRERGGEGERGE